MYYKFIPVWKNNHLSVCQKHELGHFPGVFIGDNSIVDTKFASIKDGIEAMRLDGTCLREKNWEILECSFFNKKRIMLKSLYDSGYFQREIKKDDSSEYYIF